MIPVDPTIAMLPDHFYCLTFKVAGDRMFRAFKQSVAREFYIEAVLESCATEISSFELRPDGVLS
jgi:hypothetical protein